MRYATIDFETKPVAARPHWPSEPVGLAVRVSGRSRYYAWGHPTKNNCTYATARSVLRDLLLDAHIVGFNLAYDLTVAREFFGLTLPPWHRTHDVQVLAFLDDPNTRDLDLKSLAERHLGATHEAKSELQQWIYDHVSKRAPSKWGQHIWQAPGDLAGRYARDDVDETWGLFRHYQYLLYSEAYEREMRILMPLSDMGSRGVPVNVGKLEKMRTTGESVVAQLHEDINEIITVDDYAPESLADAIEDADLLCDEGWIPTKKGRRSTSIDNLRAVVEHPVLVDLLEARSLLTKQLSTFVRPWLEMARDTGRIYCNWNQVRSADGNYYFGARTGRLSSSPNLQNVPVRPRQLVVEPLHLREAVEAPTNWRFVGLDYSQQELRLLAHFVGGVLQRAYQQDAHLDMHHFAQRDVFSGMGIERAQVKTLAFGIIYGMGIRELARRLGVSISMAKVLKYTYLDRLEIREHDDELKQQGYCETWGGRYCPVEPPTYFDNGGYRTWEYKLLNTEIQGSAADQTKEAMARFFETEYAECLALSVHDELNAFAHKEDARQVFRTLQECMEFDEFNVPFVAEGRVCKRWSQLK